MTNPKVIVLRDTPETRALLALCVRLERSVILKKAS